MQIELRDKLTKDGEPSGKWQLCANRGNGWYPVSQEFESYEEAMAFVKDNGLVLAPYRKQRAV